MGGRTLEADLVCHPHTVKCYKSREQKEPDWILLKVTFKP